MGDELPLRERVVELVGGYVTRGHLYGGELLLPPQDALTMAEEFTDLGIAIIFINAWTVTHTEYGPRFYLLYGCGLAPPLGRREDDTEGLLRARVTALASVIFDPYLALPDLVSLRPDIPMEWDVFHRRSPLFVWSRDDTSWWKGPQDEEGRSPIPPPAPPASSIHTECPPSLHIRLTALRDTRAELHGPTTSSSGWLDRFLGGLNLVPPPGNREADS